MTKDLEAIAAESKAKAKRRRAAWATWCDDPAPVTLDRKTVKGLIELTHDMIEARVLRESVATAHATGKSLCAVRDKLIDLIEDRMGATHRAAEAVLAAHLDSLDGLADALLTRRAELIEGTGPGLIAAALKVQRGEPA